jgi:glutamate 5-kinase
MKRVVVKVGTSTLTGGAAAPDRVYINSLAAQIAAQRLSGREVVLVTSGAIRAGMSGLGLNEKPRTIPEKQAAASVGQSALMGRYADIFANYAVAVGQVLLTRDDLRVRARYVNARNTFEALLRLGALPIVNENDTVAVDEIKVGDNDTLAALVASLLSADALILLSDVDGLFDKNPAVHVDARLVEQVEAMDETVLAMAGGAGTPGGTGGMQTKLAAARIATGSGTAMWIANGRRPNVIADCLAGVPGAGTRFAPQPTRPSARKRWLAFADEPRGTIVVNACARRALEEEGRSLLPVGVTGARGEFAPGDLVSLADETGSIFARGVTRYASGDVRRTAGRATIALADALGLPPESAAPPRVVVHRDQLALGSC